MPELEGVQAIVLTSAHAVPALERGGEGAAGVCGRRCHGGGGAPCGLQRGDLGRRRRGGSGRARSRPDAIRARALCFTSAASRCGEGLAEDLAAAGFALRRQAVYRAVAAEALSPATVEALAARQVDAVLLFSPRTARLFVELIGGHGLREPVTRIAAICLSAAVAEPCRDIAWRALRVAARPELGALLEALEAAR